MSEWITDRQPKSDDGVGLYEIVWAIVDGEVLMRSSWNVPEGQPWQRILVPAPYVKPKRWHCRFDTSKYRWEFKDHRLQGYFLLPPDCTGDLAERICDIFNEEMP
jgi:hypothetical protein